jgi:hypothetical protein
MILLSVSSRWWSEWSDSERGACRQPPYFRPYFNCFGAVYRQDYFQRATAGVSLPLIVLALLTAGVSGS